jgi:hypothetical protein
VLLRRVLARTSVDNKYEDEKKERARANDLGGKTGNLADTVAAALRHLPTVNHDRGHVNTCESGAILPIVDTPAHGRRGC